MYIFLSVSFFEQTFSAFCQNTSNRIVETEIYVSTRNFWRKLSFLKKIVGVFVFFFRNERKKFNLLTKTFWQGCENFFRRVQRIILRSFVWKKPVTFNLLAHWTNLFRNSVEVFLAGLSVKASKFLIISWHWAQTFRPFVRKTSKRAAKAETYLFTGTDWKKIS